MKLFLDTNVVIDYLAKRQPFAEDACQMIMMCCQRKYELCISALSFTTIYYVLKRQYGHEQLLTLLADISELLTVCNVDAGVIQQALKSEIADFEDAVQCYTAISYGADVIVTRNIKDFSHSPLLVKTPVDICDLLSEYNIGDSCSTLLNEPSIPYGTEGC